MSKIYKYPLELTRRQTINAKIEQCLSVQNQNGQICLWAIVDENATRKNSTIEIVGTGWDIPQNNEFQTIQHISTIQMDGCVWHFFWIK